jgi:hypothetical protein
MTSALTSAATSSPATGAITAVADALTAVTKELLERTELNNSPQMQSALVYTRLQAVLDQHRAAIADEDLANVRLLVAAPDAAA